MRYIDITQLKSIDTEVQELEIFPESWSNRKSFSLYENQPRPCSALFFICTDICSVFCSKNAAQITARKGDVVYIPKGICYHTLVDADTKAHTDTYTVNFRLFDKQNEEVSLSQSITILANRQDALFTLHAGNLSEAVHHSQRNHLRVKAEFYALMDAVASSATDSYAAYYPIRDGAEALRSQWNENIKIEEYAAMCGVSSAYFYQCFRQWSGKTPVEYRNMLRLSNAETMLRLTDMHIAYIAHTVGFEDSFYFCRVFTRQYGMSPQKYRQQFHSARSQAVPKE